MTEVGGNSSRGKKRILVLASEDGAGALLREALSPVGASVLVEQDVRRGIVLAQEAAYDVVVSDVDLDGRHSGLDVLSAIKKSSPGTEVVLVTGAANLDLAIDAVRLGAFDFVSKPLDVEEVRRTVTRALESAPLDGSGEATPPSESGDTAPGTGAALVGSSPKMFAVYKSIALVSRARTSVLIQGESGTGKELVARAIHVKGARSEGPFLAVNCGALTETLLESELFGYVKGAFTGASSDKDGLFHAARGGTLFLDEIGETSPALQVKLLRVLQQSEYTPVGSTTPLPTDVRVIAASNQDLDSLVREGRFREDLLYRLNVVTIQMPPLRERPEDIPKLIAHFVHRIRASGAPAPSFSSDALDAMMRYPWPGNVRELENTVERLALFSRGRKVDAVDLPPKLKEPAARPEDGLFDGLPPLSEIEKRYLLHVLRAVDGNRKRAAEILGIDRRTLYRMLERHAIAGPEKSEPAE